MKQVRLNGSEPIAELDLSDLVRRSVHSTRLPDRGSAGQSSAPYLVIPLSWEQCNEERRSSALPLQPQQIQSLERASGLPLDLIAGLAVGSLTGLFVPVALLFMGALFFEFPISWDVLASRMLDTWSSVSVKG